MHKMWNFYHFEIAFSPWKCEANPDSTWQTGFLWLWSFVPSSQKWIRLSKLPSYFSLKTPSFPQFSMVVARCYDGWNLNTSTLRNARRAGLETSSGINYSNSVPMYLSVTWCIYKRPFTFCENNLDVVKQERDGKEMFRLNVNLFINGFKFANLFCNEL